MRCKTKRRKEREKRQREKMKNGERRRDLGE